jgi:hypothetical protein
MIYSDSRYADGTIFTANDSRTNLPRITVYRTFPTAQSKFYYYNWVENDRIDAVANDLLGSPLLWWKIMDYNPEVIDPFDIVVGTTIRIPRD